MVLYYFFYTTREKVWFAVWICTCFGSGYIVVTVFGAIHRRIVLVVWVGGDSGRFLADAERILILEFWNRAICSLYTF